MSEKKISQNRLAKEAQLVEIVEKINAAQSIAFVSYSGLTVEQVTNLRKQCREANVQYCVLKNRLFGLALKQVGLEVDAKLLEGPNAFVFSMGDAVSGPKIISQFIEKNKLQSLAITGGIVDGAAADAKTMAVLATMPSRDEMLATLVGCLQSPISSLVAVLDQIAEQKAEA